MTTNTKLKVRRSISELQDDYKHGVKKPLEDLMRAWYGIKALRYDDPKSFFVLGGYHGEPFRGAGWGNSTYWGGYCNHGNVLFPTWHRVYLVKLEEALQSVDGCKDVMQPYWDETSEDSQAHGVPWALTQEFFELSDGRTWPGTNNGSAIPNPLCSFVLPRTINDHIGGIDANNAADYSKPAGYETVRYPKSGLVGTADKAATVAHNAQWSDYKKCVRYLDNNVIDWLTSEIIVDGKVIPTNVANMYKKCLNAPNYTVFSNATSRDQYNDNQPSDQLVQSLEVPHGAIHLAVGGIQVPTQNDDMIAGANGDMGENDTAGLDPIFFFHHSYVDRLFWLWQKNHSSKDGTSCTKKLEVIPEYPGTNSVDSQGPTPGVVPNSWLTMKSPLDPFKKADGTAYTSEDCFDIEGQLGYTYSPGSLEGPLQLAALQPGHSTKVIRVSGINRGAIAGSFLICVYAKIEGVRHLVGLEPVFSRWHVQGCANCQTHLEAKAYVGLQGFREESLKSVKDEDYDVEIHTRRGGVIKAAAPSPLATFTKRPFLFSVR